MDLRGPEVAFLGKKIAKISDFSKGDSDSPCHLLLSRPPPVDSTGKDWLFQPFESEDIDGRFSLEGFKVDDFSTIKKLGYFLSYAQNEWSHVVCYEVPKCPGHPIDDFRPWFLYLYYGKIA